MEHTYQWMHLYFHKISISYMLKIPVTLARHYFLLTFRLRHSSNVSFSSDYVDNDAVFRFIALFENDGWMGTHQ
jgi:hypothetical protein